MQKVYKGQIKDVDELRSRILTAGDKLDQRFVDTMIRQPGSGARVFAQVLTVRLCIPKL